MGVAGSGVFVRVTAGGFVAVVTGVAEAGTPSDYPGRCFSCGYLARRTVTTRRLPVGWYEMDEPGREFGMAFQVEPSPSTGEIATVPACFIRSQDIWQTIGASGDTNAERVRATKVFNLDRQCEDWYEYRIGQTPQLHQDTHHMELVERRLMFWRKAAVWLAFVAMILSGFLGNYPFTVQAGP